MALWRCVLAGAGLVALGWLLAGELLPLTDVSPYGRHAASTRDWARQQVALVALLSCLAVLFATTSRPAAPNVTSSTFARLKGRASSPPEAFLAALNVIPVVVAVAVAVALPPSAGVGDGVGAVLDAVGFISARLARLDLGGCLILTAGRGEARWLLGATRGRLGYVESVPLHRAAGWWCAGQSALHSLSYPLLYFHNGGAHTLWRSCFPVGRPNGVLNTLGLVNFFGVLAFSPALLALAVPALPRLRRGCYRAFQALHAPVALLFVICCALHDLPVLVFALPGLAGWFFDWGGASRRLPARAKMLLGTSGPWVELTVDLGDARALSAASRSPRGQWASIGVVPLGGEVHPLSLTIPASGSTAELSCIVTSKAGDWSKALARLAQSGVPGASDVEASGGVRFDVRMAGPFPCGGGDWSLSTEGCCCNNLGAAKEQPELLLLAGGTGVTGWLPTLMAAGGPVPRRCHLVWCVQTEVDYRALANRLPPNNAPGGVQVTVFITRSEAAASEPLPREAGCGAPARVLPASRKHRLVTGAAAGAAVSLAATLVGLTVEYASWGYIHDELGPALTLASYVAVHRALPVVVVVVVVAVTTAAGRLALCMAGAAEGISLGKDDAEDEGDINPLLPFSFTSEPEAKHDLRAGRPDLAALVRAAAAAAAGKRLVVAACGPATLVEAACAAVQDVRGECPDACLEFSGVDTRW